MTGGDTCERRAPIDVALQGVSDQLSMVEEAYGRLEGRLVSVLCQAVSEEEVGGELKATAEGDSNLFNLLGEFMGRMASLRRRMEDTTRRIEL